MHAGGTVQRGWPSAAATRTAAALDGPLPSERSVSGSAAAQASIGQPLAHAPAPPDVVRGASEWLKVLHDSRVDVPGDETCRRIEQEVVAPVEDREVDHTWEVLETSLLTHRASKVPLRKVEIRDVARDGHRRRVLQTRRIPLDRWYQTVDLVHRVLGMPHVPAQRQRVPDD